MILFALVLLFFAAFHLPYVNRVPVLATARDKAAYAIALGFVFAGVTHFTSPERFLAMMPPFIPAPEEMVALSGAAELAGALGLMIPATRRLAGIGLIVLLIAVFPANIYVAMTGKSVAGLPDARWYYWARLPFQLVYIGWVWWSAVRREATS